MQVAGRTDVGLIREHNEDNLVLIDLDKQVIEPLDSTRQMRIGDRGALLLVCDGMGGAAAGEVASQMAIDIVARFMIDRTSPVAAAAAGPPEHTAFARWMRAAAFDANTRIYDASRADDARAGMGTTMTALGVVGSDLVMAQVGDSRAYVLRGGHFTQVTRDQSLVNQLLETGQINEEQARMFEHSNVILQALGVQDDVEVLLSTVPLRRGDRVVLCTDGLTGVVTDDEVAEVLGSHDDMDEVCRLLIEMARGAGGPDNITVIAARFDGDGLREATADEGITYSRWMLDETAETIDKTPRALQPVQPAPAPAMALVPAAKRGDPAKTFFSMMVLLALALSGLVAATQMRNGVPCTVSSAREGLGIRIDGRDVGLYTTAGGRALKLPAGRHKVGLRGPGAPHDERNVEVSASTACKVTFDEAP